jgi:hypothetical protein
MLFERMFKSKAPGLSGCHIGFAFGGNDRDRPELAVEPKKHRRLYNSAVITMFSSDMACKQGEV